MPTIDHVQVLREKLASLPRDEFRPIGTPAAVLIPFLRSGDDWSVVFTRRSDNLRRHSGEISFPGGMVDEGEDSKAAALREAHEELGISSESCDILGKLPAVHTVVSGVLIDPWIAVITQNEFEPSPSEIEEVLRVPLSVLMDPSSYRVQRFIRSGHIFPSPAFDVGDVTIWGATARIVRSLIDLLVG